jgi:threonine synthase
MDVGDPSNFARIVSLYDGDLVRMRNAISGFSISESETVATIRRVYDTTGYILDPHTAVGVAALDSFSERLKGSAVVLATAHPAKFSSVVAHAIGHAPMIPPQLCSALDAHGEKTPLPLSYDRLKEVLLSQ